MQKKFDFTLHCKERFIQRRHGKFRHLEVCSKDCEQCKTCKAQLHDYISKNRKLINYQINESINAGNEVRSFINDTRFMMAYYDRHGTDHHVTFIHHEDLIFVVVEKDGVNAVVTCVDAKGHITSGVTMRKKFKKKQSDIL